MVNQKLKVLPPDSVRKVKVRDVLLTNKQSHYYVTQECPVRNDKRQALFLDVRV